MTNILKCPVPLSSITFLCSVHIILQIKCLLGPSPQSKQTRLHTLTITSNVGHSFTRFGRWHWLHEYTGTKKSQASSSQGPKTTWPSCCEVVCQESRADLEQATQGYAITIHGDFQDSTRHSHSQPDLGLEIMLLWAFPTLIFLSAFTWSPKGARWPYSTQEKTLLNINF